MPYGRKRCDGGMNLSAALNYCIKPNIKCKVETRTCHKWVECPVGGVDEIPPFVLYSVSTKVLANNCKEFHAWVNVVCCQYVC